MIHWSDVTPQWAKQIPGEPAQWFRGLGYRRFDASLDKPPASIRLTLNPSGSAELVVDDADALRNPEALAWVAARVMEAL